MENICPAEERGMSITWFCFKRIDMNNDSMPPKWDLIIVQHQYNNPLHEGGPQYVGPTLMWGIVVQLLYWCCKSNIFPPKYTTFHHLAYVARWSPTTFWVFLFFKNKLRWGTTLSMHIDKVVKSCIFRW
jgi:hypothetical protein